MIEIKHPIQGREAWIRVPENPNDLVDMHEWLEAREGRPLGVDTETTGLDIFSEDFQVRTIQFADGLESWVFVFDPRQDPLGDPAGFVRSLTSGRDLYFQNAAYDALAIRRYFGVELDWDRITDTRILAHLIDSRSKKEGGFGHSLQELTARFIDPAVAEEVKGSMMKMCREHGLKKDEIWESIDPYDPTYLLYAGMDPILAYGLARVLTPEVPESARGLIRYEHEVARVCAEMEFNGFLLDVDYSTRLSAELLEEEQLWEGMALLEYGTESVNANAQIAADLIDSGVELTEITDSGAWKLDDSVLGPLAEGGHPLAMYVQEAKKLKKWRTSWVDKFLNNRDGDNRCHANINPLLARTARMSITGIPAQTLPASDWTIRRCFIADPGHTMVSCDYQAQELRVLAALSGDRNMIQAFEEGADLHQMTADASGVERSIGKTVNFAYVYGSGPKNIADTCGITVGKAREVIKGFERTYPRVKALSDRLSKEAERTGYITTPTGRRLRVDKDRGYSALNYMIQSTSRDITASALLRLDEAGFTPYLRLPIHDEILACVPSEHAEWGARRIAEIMEQTFAGVRIASDADVLGPSWGSGYVTDEEREAYEATYRKEENNER